VICFNDDIHYKEIFSLNLKLHFIIRKRRKDVFAFKNFYSITKSFNPDIIHSWDTLSTLYAIPSSKILKKKLITSKITDAPPRYKRFTTFGILSEICFYFSDLILSNSYAGIKAYKVSNDKSDVIYNGFNFSRLLNLESKEKMKEIFQIKENFIVSMVANMNKNKDYTTYLESAIITREKYNDVAFLCVGDGPLKEKIEKKYKQPGIYFLGNRDNVESIINLSNIGVLITNKRNHGEGISNSLMEFMSLGKPVIALDNGGNKELIKDGYSGTIMETNNPKLLSDSIIDYMQRDDYSTMIGLNGKNCIVEKFSIEKMVNEFYEKYNKIIAR
tara:strand:- start:152 stop:1141 length:990 start_codon:yes stop_codon:yes gene_type:complete